LRLRVNVGAWNDQRWFSREDANRKAILKLKMTPAH
jgi:hypothetical protein